MGFNRRIVHYYPRALTGDGGVTVAVNGWAEAQAEAGHQVAVLHHQGDNDGRYSDRVELIEVPHRGGKRWRRTLRPEGLERFLGPSDLLVLHSGWWYRNFVAAASARKREVPYMVVPHGAYDPSVRAKRRLVRSLWEVRERRLLVRAWAVHLFFESEQSEVKSLAPTARTVVAPTGFELPGGAWVGGGGYLAWLGRFDVDHKGIDLLLGAIAHLPESDRPRLIMHGRSYRQDSEDVQGMAKRLGISQWVEVSGEVSGREKLDFLTHSEGFIYPSRWESYGLSLVEGMALGIPCVLSSTMHIAGLIESHGAAIVSNPSPADLAEAIRELRRRGPEMGRRGREFVGRHLTWPSVVQRLTDQLEELPPPSSGVRNL